MWDIVDGFVIMAGLVLMGWIYWRGYGALFDVRRGNSQVRSRAMMRVAAKGLLGCGALLLIFLLQRLLTGK